MEQKYFSVEGKVYNMNIPKSGYKNNTYYIPTQDKDQNVSKGNLKWLTQPYSRFKAEEKLTSK